MASPTYDVKLSGPLFERELTPVVRAAIQKGLLQAALLGQRLVQQQLVPGHGVKTGTYRRSVVGTAGTWNQGVVTSPMVYSAWLEEGKRHGQATRFPGYHMFQQAADQLAAENLSDLFAATVAAALGG